MFSISTRFYLFRICLTGMYAIASNLMVATYASGQLAGKTPDRGVYQPPVLVVGDDGETQLISGGRVVCDTVLTRENKLARAASTPKLLTAPASKVEIHQALSSDKQTNSATVVRDRYEHLPQPVLSDSKLAERILKPGEEGNRFRPLVNVSVEKTPIGSDELNQGVNQNHKSAGTQSTSGASIAGLIRSGGIDQSRDEAAKALEAQSNQQFAPISGSESEIQQVGYRQDLSVEQTAPNPSALGNDQNVSIDSEAARNSRFSTLTSFPLSQITRFATLPMRVSRSKDGVAHDATCDGCDACGPSVCDSIGCGIFGCDQCDVPCDTLGCDAMDPKELLGVGYGGGRKDVFSLASSHGDLSVSSSSSNWFGGIDYLMMWRRGVRLPALVTTEVTDASGTREEVIVGDDRIMTRMTSGVRITTGRWLDRGQAFGFVGRGWYGGRKQYGFDRDQSQTAILLRPFLDFTDQFTPTPETQVIAEPGRADGSVSITGDSEAFGLDLSFRRFLGAEFGTTIDLLYGYQFVRFNERLDISTQSVSLDDDFAPVGSTFAVRDSFHTFNEFHGAQIGLQTDYREGFWSFQGLAKLAFGSLSRESLREGETRTQVDASISTEPEGLLVRETNSGRVTNQQFSWVPEIDATLGWHRYEGWDLTLGYHLLAVTDAIQPCGAIDRDLGVNLSDPLTGAVRPSADLRYRTFYLHGIHFGLQRVY